MELNNEVKIPAELDYVYNCLNDLEVLQKCIPGCEELLKAEDGSLSARVVLKIGPIKAKFKGKILFNSELDKNLDGFFIQPTIIEINDLKEIDEEVFGPILHVVRYSSDKMDNLVDEINKLNYGLTLGIHSRIDSTINFISNNVNVGNIYINRNITGAVVGSQPFGGRGLSGTGPKAGGPNYLLNLLNEKTLSNDITASGGNTSLLMLSDEND